MILPIRSLGERPAGDSDQPSSSRPLFFSRNLMSETHQRAFDSESDMSCDFCGEPRFVRGIFLYRHENCASNRLRILRPLLAAGF